MSLNLCDGLVPDPTLWGMGTRLLGREFKIKMMGIKIILWRETRKSERESVSDRKRGIER